ncbi:MAG: polyprenyl synthetase family protein [Candidatus Micrarchaeaceae archaeon]
MNFGEYVEKYRQQVYKTICNYVPIKDPVEHYSIMRDYIDRQGKYRRPGLVMLTGQLFGAPIDKLILPAAAQQLSEDWILMQDDIEDDSELRRGKPAAQKLYGWVHALNASNTGHMAMWRILKDYMLQVGPEIGNRMYEKFYDMLTYTVEGQHIENNFIHYTKDLSKVSEDFYYRIADSKTCYYTVYGPMQIGAIAAGKDDSTLAMLKEIGKPAGVAFQIVDDILDMTADEAKFGKKRYGDLYEGKVTLIILHTYASATKDEQERINAIYAKKRSEKTAEEINFLVDMINKYGGIEYAKEQANRWGKKAEETLEKYRDSLPNNEYLPIMISAIEELYIRNK